MSSNVLFRDRMHEMVKDFPTMRGEIGGSNFNKTIGERLFDQMQDSKASIDFYNSTDVKEEQLNEEVRKPSLREKTCNRTRQPYISSKILNAYKVVKESEMTKMEKKRRKH